MRRLIISAYIHAMTASEPLAAWLLTVSAHGDHFGHPIF